VAENRPLTPRERILLEETDFTRPVDFHSWRRAFNQALADAGVNAQTAKALAGHASMQAHEKYLQNSQKTRTIPIEALPKIGHSAMGTLSAPSNETAKATGTDGANTAVFPPEASEGRDPKPALYQVEVHPGGLFHAGTFILPKSLWAPGVPIQGAGGIAERRFRFQATPTMTLPAGARVSFGRVGHGGTVS
jgi:hypothetical protein